MKPWVARIINAPEPDQVRLERIVHETAHKWNSGQMTRDVRQETRILERLTALVEQLEARAAEEA